MLPPDSSSQDLLFRRSDPGRYLDRSRNRQTCCEIAAPAQDLEMGRSTPDPPIAQGSWVKTQDRHEGANGIGW